MDFTAALPEKPVNLSAQKSMIDGSTPQTEKEEDEPQEILELDSLTGLLGDCEFDGEQLQLLHNNDESTDNKGIPKNRGLSNPSIYEYRIERPKKIKKPRTSESPNRETANEDHKITSQRNIVTSPLIGRSRSNSKTPKKSAATLQKSSPSVPKKVQEHIRTSQTGPKSRVSSYM